MSVLLDTHVWIWWLTGQPELPVGQRVALDRLAERELPFLSAISLWEAQMLNAKGRPKVNRPFERMARVFDLRLLSLGVDAFDVAHQARQVGLAKVIARDAVGRRPYRHVAQEPVRSPPEPLAVVVVLEDRLTPVRAGGQAVKRAFKFQS